MQYEGKQVKRIEVYDSTDNNRIIAIISDDKLETVNGYKIRVVPQVTEE